MLVLQRLEVVAHGGRDWHVGVQPVVLLLPPREEVEAKVELGERPALFHCVLGGLAGLEEPAITTLGRGLHADELTGLHGVERAGNDFLGLFRVLRADLAELRHMQELQRTGAHRRADRYVAAVLEGQLPRRIRLERHGTADAVRQVIVGKLDLVPENLAGVVQVVRDDTAGLVIVEHRQIEADDVDQRGKPKLPGL